ncbi:uncharacterized protein [Lepeophtheirus salmonis]|uniref:uncharacterized protein n=1 Tax=Lepeophtheirus salmonis TaxID=72036 RepID=UPI001AE82E27|nr:uncharacterized protein C7orf50 homolog [Lepeophtheirus salmonis]
MTVDQLTGHHVSCAGEMEAKKASNNKRKRVEDDSEGAKCHKKKKFVSTSVEESGANELQDQGPRIINMLSKKSTPMLKIKKRKSVLEKEDDTANKSASEKPSKKKKKKKKKKSSKVNENLSDQILSTTKDNDCENSNPQQPPKKIKKPKKSKAEKIAEQVLKTESGTGKHVHETPTHNKAIKYLKTWKKSPSKWKFSKCSQIWLIQNAYDVNRISDKHFNVLLEYLSSIKGGMKDMTQKRAEKIIELEEKWHSLEGTKTIDEIQKELEEVRPGEKKLDRAKEIQIILGKENK